MKLLIVSALSDELQDLKEYFCLKKNSSEFTMNGTHVYLLVTGLGAVNATMQITKFLTLHPDIDLVLNVGTCGSNTSSCPVGSIIVPINLHKLTNELCSDGYYLNNPFVSTIQSHSAITPYDGILVSALQFVEDTSIEAVFDMEAYYLCTVAMSFNIPFAAVKVVSDTCNISSYDENASKVPVGPIVNDLLLKSSYNGVKSFQFDHTAVTAPYLRLVESYRFNTFDNKWCDLRKYDLRIMQPNKEFMTPAGMHSLEHCLAHALRNVESTFPIKVWDVSMMACQTGVYISVIVPFDVSNSDVASLITRALRVILTYTTVPGATEKQCGNYKLQSLDSAKCYISKVLTEL